jgi:hypothetical protein
MVSKRAEVQIKIRERAETMLGEKMMVGSEGGDSEDLDNAPYRIPLYAMVNLINTLILGIGSGHRRVRAGRVGTDRASNPVVGYQTGFHAIN